MLWKGTKYFEGINQFFKMLEEGQYKIQNRVMLARYRGKTLCPVCHGTRLEARSELCTRRRTKHIRTGRPTHHRTATLLSGTGAGRTRHRSGSTYSARTK